MTIAELKKYVKQSDITYAELSEKSGIPLSTIKAIFGKQTKNPRLDTINAIENALGLNKKTAEETPPHSKQSIITDIQNMSTDEFNKVAPLMEQLIKALKK